MLDRFIKFWTKALYVFWVSFLKGLWYLIIGKIKLIVGIFKFTYWILRIEQYIKGFRSMCAWSIFMACLALSTGVVAWYALNYSYGVEYSYDERN